MSLEALVQHHEIYWPCSILVSKVLMPKVSICGVGQNGRYQTSHWRDFV